MSCLHSEFAREFGTIFWLRFSFCCGSDSTDGQVLFLEPAWPFALATRDRFLETYFALAVQGMLFSRIARARCILELNFHFNLVARASSSSSVLQGSSVDSIRNNDSLGTTSFWTTLSYRSSMVCRSESRGDFGAESALGDPCVLATRRPKNPLKNHVTLTPLIH